MVLAIIPHWLAAVVVIVTMVWLAAIVLIVAVLVPVILLRFLLRFGAELFDLGVALFTRQTQGQDRYL